MKLLILGLLVVVLVAAGCREIAQQVPLAQKKELRKILDTTFIPASISEEREEDFYHILNAFGEGRESDEFVRSVVFKSASEAEISFIGSPNLHGGGGNATAKKQDGRWIITEKVWVV